MKKHIFNMAETTWRYFNMYFHHSWKFLKVYDCQSLLSVSATLLMRIFPL